MPSLAEQLSNACKAFAQAVTTDIFGSSKANLHSTIKLKHFRSSLTIPKFSELVSIVLRNMSFERAYQEGNLNKMASSYYLNDEASPNPGPTAYVHTACQSTSVIVLVSVRLGEFDVSC